MSEESWETLESAWATRYQQPPKSTPLPTLIADADRAVAAAVRSLTSEHASLTQHLDDLHSCEAALHSSDVCAEATEANSGTDSEVACDKQRSTAAPPCTVVEASSESSGVDWQQLYRQLCLIQAPMVRCSRPAFRQVCRQWGTTISYTHMLIAESFVKSPHARHAEFARYDGEDRLIVQLAAKSGPAAARAALLVRRHCDAVDLNCGCPQRWAMKEGIGAALLEKPELVADMVRCIRNAAPEGNGDSPALPCVVKMRLYDDVRRSVDFARQCEAAGAAWVTVHGRTPQCAPSAPVRHDAVRLVRESLSISVVLNGGVSDVSTALESALRTGCGGLMAANGLLDNPAMFYCAGSAAALQAEASFGADGAAWTDSTIESGSAGPTEAASPFTPLRQVSFLWAPPQRRGSCDALSSSFSSPPAVSVKYTVPTMWESTYTPREAISDFVRCALRTDLTVPTTVQQVLRMARMYVSPAERNHLALLRSNVSVLRCLQEIGVYVEQGHVSSE